MFQVLSETKIKLFIWVKVLSKTIPLPESCIGMAVQSFFSV